LSKKENRGHHQQSKKEKANGIFHILYLKKVNEIFLKARKKCGFEEVALADFQAAKRQLPSYLVRFFLKVLLKHLN
jgi:hypothetical protein